MTFDSEEKKCYLSLSLYTFLSESTLKGPLLRMQPHGVVTEVKALQVLNDLCPLHIKLVLGHPILHKGDQLFLFFYIASCITQYHLFLFFYPSLCLCICVCVYRLRERDLALI